MKAVIGLGFGDESKGVVVNYLINENSLVVRYSGGQQAGHTVMFNGKRHVFSNFGSGTLKGSPTYWSKFCTVDPVGIIKELEDLIKLGVNPLLYIDGDSPVTTPYDKFYNRNSDKDLKHGTCGVGVGSTINREENYYSLTFSDLFNPWILDIKLENIKNFYKNIDLNDMIDEFLECCYKLTISKNIKLTYGIPKIYSSKDIIFEGSQGLLLDQHYGFFPHCARTNTGTKNILGILKNENVNLEIYLVTRAYQTRHGNGPMSNEHIDHDIKIEPNETNVSNKYQGEFRRSILDVSLLEYAINKDEKIREIENKHLVISCLDHLNEYVFTYKNKLVLCKNENEFVEKISNILNIKNVLVNDSPYSETIRLK